MTRIVIVSIVLALSIGMIGCELQEENIVENERIRISNNVETLSSRISFVNQSITGGSEADKIQAKSKDKFVHLANVSSPQDQNGNVLSATSVYYHKHLAFVSYHLNGAEYGGAIEMFDLSDPDEPEILSQVLFDDTDINALVVDDNFRKVWFVGGRDVDASGYNTEVHKGAILGGISFDNKELVTNIKELPLPSYSGNAVIEMGQSVYATSGATGGGTFKIDKNDLEIEESMFESYAKYIDRRDDDIVGLSVAGDNAELYTIDFKSMEINTYNTGLDVLPKDGKNVLEHRADITFVALGDKGIRGYKLKKQQDPIFIFDGYGNDAANGVTTDGKYVHIAHGTDGLFITKKPKNGQELELITQWNDESGASANYVKTDPSGKCIFVAKGTGGLNILLKE